MDSIYQIYNGTQTVGTGGVTIWPYVQQWPTQSSWVWSYPETPRECSGDVHVFPCPHCDKCKCGKASVKQKTKGGEK
jgi:hypothetical protein